MDMKKRNIKIPPFSPDFGRSHRNPKNSIETSPENVTTKVSPASILNFMPDASSEPSEDLKLINKVKTLMGTAKSPKWKIECPNVDNRSIKEKIVDLYLKYAEKKEIQKGAFIKCDIIKELVEREKLNYLRLDVFPNKNFMLYINIPENSLSYWIISGNEHDFDPINYQEIPKNIFDILLNGIYGINILYDNHVILEIRKYATSNDKVPPIFSFFTLLKPPSTLTNWDIGKMTSEEKIIFEKRQKEYESEVMSKRSGPVHWSLTDPTTLEFMCFLATYCHPFASSFQRRTLPEETKPKQKAEGKDIKSMISTIEKIPPMPVTCVAETVDVIPNKFDSMKAGLRSSLDKREIKFLKECDYKNELSRNLVEIFYFDVGDAKLKKKISHVLVFTDRNGAFYTYSKDKDYIPCPYKGIPLNCVGSRHNLDKYLFQLAEMKSKNFMQRMCVLHENVASNIKTEFFSCGNFFPENMDISTQEYDNKKKRSVLECYDSKSPTRDSANEGLMELSECQDPNDTSKSNLTNRVPDNKRPCVKAVK